MGMFKTEVFQLDGVDVVAGDLIRVNQSGPYQRDNFVGRVQYAHFRPDGTMDSITVYGGPGEYVATRTLRPERFEVMTSKHQEKARLDFEKRQQKAHERAAKESAAERKKK